jgi:holliday junction DNA helicase RuvA
MGGIAAPVAAGAIAPSGAVADAISALVNFGYAKSAAYGAVMAAATRLGGDAKIDALVRAGLQELGR